MLEHDRLPGPPVEHPRPRRRGDLRALHTLNGTAITARSLIALLETFQCADGSVVVPEVLVALRRAGEDRPGERPGLTRPEPVERPGTVPEAAARRTARARP